jgi:hypothetical protein
MLIHIRGSEIACFQAQRCHIRPTPQHRPVHPPFHRTRQQQTHREEELDELCFAVGQEGGSWCCQERDDACFDRQMGHIKPRESGTHRRGRAVCYNRRYRQEGVF